jgi:hypothetical protein
VSRTDQKHSASNDSNPPKKSTDRAERAADQWAPEAFAAFQEAEIEKWWPIIKAAGIKGE